MQFEYDSLCMLTGLNARADLNGRAVRVCLPNGKIEPVRVPVQLMVDCRYVSVKAENLVPLPNKEALEIPHVKQAMPAEDREDCRMFFFAMHGSEVIAPGVIRMSTKLSKDEPLIDEEKAEALRLGQWGDVAKDPTGWSKFCYLVKTRRGDEYPPDWHEQIIRGKLFKEAGQPTRSGFHTFKT